jgi:ubiquinone/menaquinone biosynthesis C-methylase UbiE
MTSQNIDVATVEGFGDEWERFDQTGLKGDEYERLFQGYFDIFPWDDLPVDAEGFDLGCGSGRWAAKVAPKVGTLHCIDPSSALTVAKRNLASIPNCVFHQADVESIPLDDSSMDFGYSLGVLHHIPDTGRAMTRCVEKLKPGAPFLVYLYYSFENRPAWFRAFWKTSELGRAAVSKLPHSLRDIVSQVLALTVYWPLARTAAILEKLGFNVGNIPLSSYRSGSFYTMRTDALDRFGTRLEQRFSRQQIQDMMERAGLQSVQFSETEPYWCAMGRRKSDPSGGV